MSVRVTAATRLGHEGMRRPRGEGAPEGLCLRAMPWPHPSPAGYVALGTQPPSGSQLELWVVSELHSEDEYGAQVDPSTGQHSGGAFKIKVDAGIRIEALRNVIRDEGGIIPALQKLSYAGKHLDDSQRTLAHYGVAYWHARFPHWPIKIRRF
ncbi:hypothetical protein V8C86DRAFT_587345 [Haematococcus lacustris]